MLFMPRQFPVPSGLWPAVTPSWGMRLAGTSRLTGTEETATMAVARKTAVENFIFVKEFGLLGKVVN